VLADQCNFGEFLDRALRDRFVAGVKSQNIREQCLKLGSSAKFDQTVKLASEIELVDKHARLMQTNSGADSNLNRVFQRNGQKNHRGRGHQLRQSNPYKSNGQNGGRSTRFARSMPTVLRTRGDLKCAVLIARVSDTLLRSALPRILIQEIKIENLMVHG
jgi:hypothetical protein